MRVRTRVAIGLLAAALPFVARWLHDAYRAPVGRTEGILEYSLLALLCIVVIAVTESPPVTTSLPRVVIAAARTTFVFLGLAAAWQVFFPDSYPRFVLLVTTAMLFAYLVLAGVITAAATRARGRVNRVLAVVDKRDADQLEIEAAEGPWEQHFSVVGTVTDEADYGRVAALCAERGASVLVLGPAAAADDGVIDQAEALHMGGLKVRSLDDFYDEALGKLPLTSLDRFALMGDIESLHGSYAALKRSIDLGLAALGSLALLVMTPVVLLGNLIGNRGPLLFSQPRVGLHGSEFHIWKFRTMAPGAVDVSGWTKNDDPRITRFGKLLRRTHLDELPQVVNIFKGELSVVGPRPEQVVYARQLEQSLPFYSARHRVRPGLTGWAQVKYPYAASEEDAFVKLQFDLHYVRHESLATDLRIMWLTLRHLLVDGGR
jgi:lipopolysaccharide/colanic/teichoic acid biosynthesis glycosyltransferase